MQYILPMFPYPSGRLHMGHIRNYIITDIITKSNRIRNIETLHPIGWDSFGLPAENAASEYCVHPKEWINKNIQEMRQALKQVNFSFNWENELKTSHTKYYTQQQKIFTLLRQHGYIIQKDSWVNWDPKDKTVLANEQIVNGRCWRSNAKAEKRRMKQWFFQASKMSEELLKDSQTLTEWPKTIINMQNNWIGKHEIYTLNFVDTDNKTSIKIGTTRPETIHGVTFVAICPEQANDLISEKEISDMLISQDKLGIKTNINLINPITKESVPLYVANYITNTFGTGAIMGVPAEDDNDREFAEKYNIPIQQIIANDKMINSGDISNLDIHTARKQMASQFNQETCYKMQDWCISRQRYWGCPIPIIYCDKCGILDNKQSVILPEEYSGFSSLIDNHEWQKIKCPSCGQIARKETDTMDTFMDSSWYYLRYFNPNDDNIIPKTAKPVDIYVGGIEHAILHLLYSRMITKALNKIGIVSFNEPFKKLVTQGMICKETYQNQNGEWLYPDDVVFKNNEYQTLNGEKVNAGRVEKMSKSKKNVVTPEQILQKFDCDSMRWFVSSAPIEKDMTWSDNGIKGAQKLIQQIESISETIKGINAENHDLSSNTKIQIFNKNALKCIQNLHFHKLQAEIHTLINEAEKSDQFFKYYALQATLPYIYTMMPIIADQIWNKHFTQKMHFMHHTDIEETPQTKVLVNNKFVEKIEINTEIEQNIKSEILNNTKNERIINAINNSKKIIAKKNIVNIIT